MPAYSITEDFTVYGGETLTATNDYLLYVYDDAVGSSPSIVVNGQLELTVSRTDFSFAAINFEGAFYRNATVTIGATGGIRVVSEGSGSAIRGVWTPGLVNRGLIEVTAVTNASGVAVDNLLSAIGTTAGASFENSGVIRVTGGLSAHAAYFRGEGAFLNSGTIEARGGSEGTTAVRLGSLKVDAVNSGVIRASDNGAARDAVGLDVSGGYGNTATLYNSGAIEGEVALRVGFSSFAGPRIVNTGSIVGKVELAGAVGLRLENSGAITGAVTMSAGDDTYDGRNGTLVGQVYAGAGNDSLAGGAGAESFFGDAGDDTIVAGGGADSVTGGLGADRLDGGEGIDTLSYAQAAGSVTVDLQAQLASGAEGQDTVQGFERVLGGVWGDVLRGQDLAETLIGGFGHDTLQGRAGDDVLQGDGGDDILSGDEGLDTLTGGTGADLFIAQATGGLDHVTDFNFSQGDRVQVAPGAVYTLRQEGADAVLDFGGGNRMVLAGVDSATLPAGWIIGSAAERPAPTPAWQAATTVNIGSLPYTLPEGEALWFSDQNGVSRPSPGDTNMPPVEIAGWLHVVATSATTGPGEGFSAFALSPYSGFNYGRFHIASTGRVAVDMTATLRNATGVNASGWAPQIVNDGVLTVLGRRDAYGVQIGGHSDQLTDAFTNSGTISVTTEGRAWGVYMYSGDEVVNSGVIDVRGAEYAEGVHFFQWSSKFINLGAIRAVDQNPNADSVAVYFNSTVFGGFLNQGVLEGDYALKVVSYHGTSFEQAAERFENTGFMYGKVDMGHQAQILVNSGAIIGEVTLGSGNDVYDGVQGSVSGMVSGGLGADTMAGGGNFEYLHGNEGADWIHGGGGDDWVVGGKDDDQLFGGPGADLVLGNLGADILEGGEGDDILRGGQGNDVLRGGAGDDWMSGDRGDDTLTGGSGADIFHTFDGAGLDRVTDFNAAEGDRVYLLPGTLWNVVQEGADVVVLAGDARMVLVNVQISALQPGWIFGA